MMSATELRAYRKVTAGFIAANPTEVILTPRERIKSATGVRWVEKPPRDPQNFRIIDQSSASGPVPGTVTTPDGVQRIVVFQLLGPWNSVVELHDVWTDAEGVIWEIAEVLPANGYETRAQVARYGEE